MLYMSWFQLLKVFTINFAIAKKLCSYIKIFWIKLNISDILIFLGAILKPSRLLKDLCDKDL